jgi:hypothetical protein
MGTTINPFTGKIGPSASAIQFNPLAGEFQFTGGSGDPILEIADLVLYAAAWFPSSYLDAGAEPVTDGEAVATVLDQSGEDNNLEQTTGLNRPLWDEDGGPNGLGATVYDGVNSFMVADPEYGVGTFSLFLVGRFLTVAGTSRILGFAANASIGCFGVGGSWGFFDSGGGIAELGGDASEWSIVEWHMTAEVGFCAVNGVETALGVLSAVAPSGILALGNEADAGTKPGHVSIPATVRYGRQLTTDEIAIVRAELSERTGIPV